MGTSTSYSAPPSWGQVKGEVTRAARAGTLTSAAAQLLIQHYIQENGGARGMSSGAGSVATGHAAPAIAGRLGNFISDVAAHGLDEALSRAGLAEFVGKPVQEILNGLLDKIGGPANTIDDVDARNALASLRQRLLGDALDATTVEQILAEQVVGLEGILQDFFGFYLYEQFCRVFFERLVQRVGESKAESFLSEIEDFINSTLANRTTGRDMSRINWSGPDGQAIMADIMETTLKVFGG